MVAKVITLEDYPAHEWLQSLECYKWNDMDSKMER
jgi:hypothetical protein